MSFVIRTLQSEQTLGEKLKHMRKELNFTLSEMSEKTKIRKAWLKAFEENRFGELPDPVYAKNFLKLYVRSLGGDVAYFLNQFEEECSTCSFIDHSRMPRTRALAWQFLVASRFVKVLGVLLVAGAVSVYVGGQVQAILAPPELIVLSPSDGDLLHEAQTTVSGRAQEEAHVRINDVDVLLNADGTFSAEVALERGLNVITIESAKRYSKSTIEYRRVILDQDNSISLAP